LRNPRDPRPLQSRRHRRRIRPVLSCPKPRLHLPGRNPAPGPHRMVPRRPPRPPPRQTQLQVKWLADEPRPDPPPSRLGCNPRSGHTGCCRPGRRSSALLGNIDQSVSPNPRLSTRAFTRQSSYRRSNQPLRSGPPRYPPGPSGPSCQRRQILKLVGA